MQIWSEFALMRKINRDIKIRAYSDFALPETKLFYWRLSAWNEVDFVFYGGKTFTAAEVKNTKIDYLSSHSDACILVVVQYAQ